MATPTAPRRFTPPWTAIDTGAAFRVETADGVAISWVYYRDNATVSTGPVHLTKDEARRIAAGIVRLPELLGGG